MPVARAVGLAVLSGLLVAVCCGLAFTFVQGVPAHRAWPVCLALGGAGAVAQIGTWAMIAWKSR